MNHLHYFSIKRKFALLIMTMLSCAAIIFAVILTHVANSALANSDGTAKTSVAREADGGTIGAIHNYTSIEAGLYNSGVKIFIGLTTPADLKQNLSVYGTFGAGSAAEKVALLPSEYSLSMTAGSATLELSDSQVIFSEALTASSVTFTVNAKYGNEATKTNSFIFYSTNIVSAENAAPVYTSLSINTLSGITSDYTAEALKLQSGLVVYANGDTSKPLINREFYEINNLGALSYNGSATFTVKYVSYVIENEGEDPIKQAVTLENCSTGTISRPKMIAADLQAKPDGNFVVKMTSAQILSGLALTVYYEHSSRVLNLTVDGNTITADTDETVSFYSGWNNLSDKGTVTLSLEVSSYGKTKTVYPSVTVTLEDIKVVSIEVARNSSNEELKLSSLTATDSVNTNTFDGFVLATYSNGTTGYLSTSEYTVSGYLTPDAEAIKLCTGSNPQSTYKKNITISYDSAISCTYEVEVVWKSIGSFQGFNGVLPVQTYRCGINFGTVELSFKYPGFFVSTPAPISDFADEDETFIRTVFYGADGEETDDKVFSTDTTKIAIWFRYSLSAEYELAYIAALKPNSSQGEVQLYINKLDIPIPVLSTSEETFSPTLSKPVDFAVSKDDEAYSAIQNLLNSDGGIAFYNDWDCQTEVAFGIEYDKASKSLVFTSGGEYYVCFSLTEEDSKEIQWGAIGGNDNIRYYLNSDYTKIIYKIKINRGPIDVSLNYTVTEWSYGEFYLPQIIISPQGSGKQLIVVDNEEDVVDGETVCLPYVITYIQRDETTGTEKTVLYPTDAGTYYVRVQIFETAAYKEGYSAEPDYDEPQFGAPSVKVKPAIIKTGIKEITYDGNDRYIDDFLTLSGFANTTVCYVYYKVVGEEVYEQVNVTVNYDDKASDVLAYADGSGLSSEKFKLADGYERTLKLTDTNYEWEETDSIVKTEKTVNFSIYVRELGMTVKNDGDFDFNYQDDYDVNARALDKIDFTFTEGEMKNGAYVYTSSNLTNSTFFAELDAIIFYQVEDGYVFDDKNCTVNKGTLVSADKSDEWSAGTYIVIFTTKLADGDSAGNYTLPAAYAEFIISPKPIDRAELLFSEGGNANGQSGTYDGNYKNFILGNTKGYWLSDNSVLNVSIVGVAYDGSTKVPDISYAFATATENGTLKILNAGTYTVKVEIINKNYVWKPADPEEATADLYTLEFGYSVERLEMHAQEGETVADGDTFKWGKTTFYFDPFTPQYTKPETVGIAKTDNLTLMLEYYDGDGTKIDNADTIIYAGQYTVKIIGWIVDGGGDWTCAYNYKASEELSVTFSIQSSSVSVPTLIDGGTSVSVYYNGSQYVFSDFIYNYSQYVYGTNLCQIGITVTPKDADRRIMTDAGTYDVSIKPQTNFKWDTEKSGAADYAVTFTFVIMPKELTAGDFEWFAEDDANFSTVLADGTYKEYVFDNKNHGLLSAVVEDALCAGDDRTMVKVLLKYSSDERKFAETAYVATAYALDGDRAFNYLLPDETLLSTKTFVIKKREISISQINAPTSTFDGQTHSATIVANAPDFEGFSWNGVAYYTYKHEFRFGTEVYGTATEYLNYNLIETKLEYVNAGRYTVTVALSDTNNYCWSDTENTSIELVFDIARMEVTAPAINENRTMSYGDGNGDPEVKKPFGTADTGILTVDGHKVNYSIVYGIYNGSFENVTASCSPIDYGKYYIQLKITNESPLNYLWILNADDDTNKDILSQNDYNTLGETAYGDGDKGVSVFISYMITKKILSIGVTEIENYVYGDNGYPDKIYQNADINFDGNYFTLNGNDKNLVGAEDEVTYSFYKITDLSTDMQEGAVAENKLTSADLNNGLPWDSGVYGILINVHFTSETTQYQDIPIWTTFAVTARPIEVEWKWSDGEDGDVYEEDGEYYVYYDGNGHILVATITNLAKKSENDNPSTPSLIVNGGVKVKDAGSYVLKVTRIVGDDNYKIDESEVSITKTLTVLPREITIIVKGNGADDVIFTHVYNKNISYPVNLGEDYWYYADGSAKFIDGDKVNVTFILKTSDGTQSVTQGFNAGFYQLQPVLDGDENVKSNYKLVNCTNGLMEIVAREIKLSIDNGATTRVYGTAYDAEAPVYKIEWLNKGGGDTDENWLVDGDLQNNVFVVSSSAFAKFAGTGIYDVDVTIAKSANYKVTLNEGDDWKGVYTITPATITELSVDTVGNVVYDAREHAYIGALITASAAAVNPDDGSAPENALRWFIAEATEGQDAPDADITDTSVWTEVTDKSEKNAFSGNYWVMVYASNHFEYVYENPVTVAIAKAQVAVKLSLEIFYGENKPENENYLMDTDGLKSGKYTFDKFAGNETISVIDGLDGTFYYTTVYSRGDGVGEYGVMLYLDGLISTNYEFYPAADGESNQLSSLTVKALPVTVEIVEEYSVNYWNWVNSKATESYVYGELITISVRQDVKSTYGGALTLPEFDELLDIVKLKILKGSDEALTYANGSVVAMGDVGDYVVSLDISQNNSNYDIPSAADGKLIINRATISEIMYGTDAEFGGLSETYNGADYTFDTLIYFTAENYGAVNNTTDSYHVWVKYAVNPKDPDNITDGEWKPYGEITLKDAAQYNIYYLIHADNHCDVTVFHTITINKTINSFETQLKFFNEKNYYDGNFDEWINTEISSAWIYGKYDADTNVNGYDNENANKLLSAVAKFNGVPASDGNNPIKYYLFADFINKADLDGAYSDGSVSGFKVLGFTVGDGVNEWFLSLFEEGYIFDAGNYTVYYRVDGNENYDFVSECMYFKIAPKQLTLNARDKSVIYGEELAFDTVEGLDFNVQYAYDFSGLVNNGLREETILDVFGGVLPLFTSSYVAGKEKGSVKEDGYVIYLENAGELKSDNYSVNLDYGDVNGTLTVTPRPVELIINEYSVKFNFNSAYSSNLDKEATLECEFGGMGFIDEEVIGLETNAVINSSKTKDVGVYPIFAYFLDADHKANYQITFSGALFNSSKATAEAEKYGLEDSRFYYTAAQQYFSTLNSEKDGLVICGANGGIDDFAGVYYVVPANLKLSTARLNYVDADGTNKLYSSLTEEEKAKDIFSETGYDGYEKLHTATADYVSGISFYAVYSTVEDEIKYLDVNDSEAVGKLADRIKDAGTYFYKFVVDSPNYIWEDNMYSEFTINKRVLGWEINLSDSNGSTEVANSAEYKAEYYGYNYYLTYGFSRLVSGEAVSADNTSVVFNENFLDGTNSQFKKYSLGAFESFTTNLFKVTAVNAGKYSVEIALADGTAMKNYTFEIEGGRKDVSGGKIVFDFHITRAKHDVNAASGSELQYGSLYNADGTPYERFTGFTLDRNTLNLIAFEQEKFIDYSGVMYSVFYKDNGVNVDYNASNSLEAGKSYNIQPSGLIALNYDFTFKSDNFVKIVQREITVTVNGYQSDTATLWASAVYDGTDLQPECENYVGKFFTLEDGWYGEAVNDGNADNATIISLLALDLYKSGDIDAGTYTLTARQYDAYTNYNVTFCVKDGSSLIPIENASDTLLPRFVIKQKQLTIQAGWIGAIAESDFTDFEITYGNMLITDGEYYYFTVRYYGFVEDDGNENEYYDSISDKVYGKLEYVAENSDGLYEAWVSRSGTVYTVSPYGLSFKNYDVDYVYATMTVKARLVTAATTDRVYTELTSDGSIIYNNGISGIEHNAQIIFADSDPLSNYKDGIIYYSYENGVIVTDSLGNVLFTDINSYVGAGIPPAPNNSIKVVYTGSGYNGKEFNLSETAPDVAGEYMVTVELLCNNLNSYDFKFNTDRQQTVTGKNGVIGNVTELSVTFAYEVQKRNMNVTVNTVNINDFEGIELVRSVYGYINPIMTVGSITNVYSNADGEAVTDRLVQGIAGSLEGKQYAIRADENYLDINVYGIGLYTATIVFNEYAAFNYEWLDSDDEQLAVSFRVSASAFKITELSLKDGESGELTGSWSYGSVSPEPVFSVDIENIKVVLTYRYARLKELPDIDGLTFGTMIDGATDAMFVRDGYSLTFPTAAGIYVLYASYPGSDDYSSTEAYLVFEIKKAEVLTPEIIVGSLNSVYTGEVLDLELSYDTAQLNISYEGTMSVSEKGIILHATDVKEGGYEIKFTLVDTDNYTWAENSFIWIISPAADNAITEFDVSALEDVTYDGNAVALPSASATYGNEGLYIEFFIGGEWTQSVPVSAGIYKVRAVSPATANYFNKTAGTAAYSDEFEFVIKRAKLTVTPYGTAEYGVEFNKDGGAGYSLSYDGFAAGVAEVAGIAEYVLVAAPEKLITGKYTLTLAPETETQSVDGIYYTVVKGLSLNNYYIVVSAGVFTVTPASLYVAVGNVGAVYGDELDLSSAELTVISGKLVYDDDIESLNITLDIDGDYKVNEGKYPVDFYMMSADYDNDNYSIVFGSGIYTVRALDIILEIGMTNGVYGKQAPSAQVISLVTADGRDLTEIDGIIIPQFTFIYYGTSNDGQWNYSELNARSILPVLAGTYMAKAVGTVTSNFNLVTTPAASFTIEKQELDASVITFRTEYYSGNPITPYVNPNGLSDKYTVIPVEYTNVGNWDVTLVLKDFYNYKWLTVDVAERVITFSIEKGENSFVKDSDGEEVTINGWTYGQTANSPSATGRFGNPSEFIYEYSDAENGTYTVNVPSLAGTWWVRVTAPQSDNYNRATSSPVSFVIAKAPVSAPSLYLTASGEGQNAVYSGERLEAMVQNYNSALMYVIYAGEMSSVGGSIKVFAVNAGTYKVLFALNDYNNYCWADGVNLEDGNALIEWTIARKKLEKPVADDKSYMVNGGTLTYLPVGFDENTMNIEGNKTSYGGLFKVTVSLKDTENYEWADSSVEDIVFDWTVVGWDTVFVIVVSVLGVVAGIAAIAIGIQYILHRRKKLAEVSADANSVSESVGTKEEKASAGSVKTAEEKPEKETETPAESKAPAEEKPVKEKSKMGTKTSAKSETPAKENSETNKGGKQ